MYARKKRNRIFPPCLRWPMLALAGVLSQIPAVTADEFDDLDRIEAVSDGQLRFILPSADTEGVHHHYNEISLLPESMEQGWVHLRQCHENLDPVSALQIVFNPHRIRNLSIDRSQHVGKTWVQGASVQLEDITHGARICLSGESRILTALGDRVYQLSNGPYMRKFLDGYYPMRVTVRVDLNGQPLRFEHIDPRPQPGFRVQPITGGLMLETLFEGRLSTEIRFVRTDL